MAKQKVVVVCLTCGVTQALAYTRNMHCVNCGSHKLVGVNKSMNEQIIKPKVWKVS